MTSPSMDPRPENTPGLEPGNGVAPGDTPPAESSESGAIGQQPDLPSRRTNKVVYGVVIASGLLVVLMLLAYATDVFG